MLNVGVKRRLPKRHYLSARLQCFIMIYFEWYPVWTPTLHWHCRTRWDRVSKKTDILRTIVSEIFYTRNFDNFWRSDPKLYSYSKTTENYGANEAILFMSHSWCTLPCIVRSVKGEQQLAQNSYAPTWWRSCVYYISSLTIHQTTILNGVIDLEGCFSNPITTTYLPPILAVLMRYKVKIGHQNMEDVVCWLRHNQSGIWRRWWSTRSFSLTLSNVAQSLCRSSVGSHIIGEAI